MLYEKQLDNDLCMKCLQVVWKFPKLKHVMHKLVVFKIEKFNYMFQGMENNKRFNKVLESCYERNQNFKQSMKPL